MYLGIPDQARAKSRLSRAPGGAPDPVPSRFHHRVETDAFPGELDASRRLARRWRSPPEFLRTEVSCFGRVISPGRRLKPAPGFSARQIPGFSHHRFDRHGRSECLFFPAPQGGVGELPGRCAQLRPICSVSRRSAEGTNRTGSPKGRPSTRYRRPETRADASRQESKKLEACSAMSHALAIPTGRDRRGFSLVELSVVVIIIGVLAAFGVPRLFQSVERSKASESFKYLASVRAAQERYQARQGTYASDVTELDMEQTTPTYFDIGTITASEDSWSLTLTRSGASGGYGDYTVTFTEAGFDSANSTISDDINPQST